MINAVAGTLLMSECKKLNHLGKAMEDHNTLGYYNVSKEFFIKFKKNTVTRPAQSTISAETNTTKATAEKLSQTEPTSKGASSTSPAPSKPVDGPLAFLRDDPVFTQLKRQLQEDQSKLPYLMRKTQSINRDLMRIVTDNAEEFLKLINDQTSEPSLENGGSQGVATTTVNNLSPSDVDASNRLKELGYPEHLVIQAYIAGERNLYKAADFLVSQALDDDDD
ncbi:UV excision repair protein RAD23 homolog B-like [Anopheles bellator]|uniref:UV excision repair protein RAD23 homolog B-like n=1 Tax=Anopheles bellator TaxID=139047 RepID=UPI002648A5A7|nr:UV excision repair protein RAD23 homolog B-like [Anopheles bellator]